MFNLNYLIKQPLPIQLALGFLLVSIVGVLDYLTGPDLAFSIFYIIPIFLAVFLMGRRGGLIISVFSAIVYYLADILTPTSHIHPAILAWNAFVNMIIFFLVTFAIVELLQQWKRKRQEELMHFIVHDLRTPLNNVMIGLTVIEAMGDHVLGKAQKRMLKTAQSSSKWMSMLIDSILELSRMESGLYHLDIGPVNVHDLVESSLQQVALWAEQGSIEIIQRLELEDQAAIRADREITIRVLVNLLSNAIKFTPKGKTITLSVGRHGPVEIVFCVADQGCGVPKEWTSRVFDKYSQVEMRKVNALSGIGLGLTFCRMCVEAQQGRIWLESKVGQGTRIFFTLPIKEIEEPRLNENQCE
jgi:signal transduction histidine kinase